MPFNLIKVYNQLLELNLYRNTIDRTKSLRKVFDRDIRDENFTFGKNKIIPPSGTENIGYDALFDHLTTKMVNEKTKERDFCPERSARLHWIRFHTDKKRPEILSIFHTYENKMEKINIIDNNERYGIFLGITKHEAPYLMLTAFKLSEKNYNRLKNKQGRNTNNNT